MATDAEARRKEIHEQFGEPAETWGSLFFNQTSLRLTKEGFQRIQKVNKFYKALLKPNQLKVQDLVKISNQNIDLFYIDKKNNTIYTLDMQFAHWTNLMDGENDAWRNE